jgi:hypothetical protein
MGRPAIKGESPVLETDATLSFDPKYRGTRETPWESGRTTS